MSENWKGTFLAVLALSYKATMTSGSYRFPSTPWHYGKAGATWFTIVRMAVFLSKHLYTSLKKKKEDCQMGEHRLSAWQRCYKSGVFCFKSENMRVNKKIIVWVSPGDWESKKTRSSRFPCFLVSNQTISTSGHWAHYKKTLTTQLEHAFLLQLGSTMINWSTANIYQNERKKQTKTHHTT